MRLTGLVPSISAELVELMETIDIRTDTDLLFTSSTVDIMKRLPQGSLSIDELEAAKETVIELCSSLGEPACHVHSEAKLQTLSMGCEAFDDLLHGLLGGTILQVSGDKGTGKTVGSLSANLYSVLEPDHSSFA